jgi:hypothetical protein
VREILEFTEPPAVVDLKFGLTINLGNYESCRLDVGLTLPCPREDVDVAFAKVKAWVEQRVTEEVAEIQAGRKKHLF